MAQPSNIRKRYNRFKVRCTVFLLMYGLLVLYFTPSVFGSTAGLADAAGIAAYIAFICFFLVIARSRKNQVKWDYINDHAVSSSTVSADLDKELTNSIAAILVISLALFGFGKSAHCEMQSLFCFIMVIPAFVLFWMLSVTRDMHIE